MYFPEICRNIFNMSISKNRAASIYVSSSKQNKNAHEMHANS